MARNVDTGGQPPQHQILERRPRAAPWVALQVGLTAQEDGEPATPTKRIARSSAWWAYPWTQRASKRRG